MSTIEVLAVIGGIAVILTAAAKIPAALAEFIRAWILVAEAARDLCTALTRHGPHDKIMPASPKGGSAEVQRTPDINADDSGN